jgi:hypothetical protein
LTACTGGKSHARIRRTAGTGTPWGQVVTTVTGEEPILVTALQAARAPSNPQPAPAATTAQERLTRRCARAPVRSPLLYFAAALPVRLFEFCL